MQGVLRTWVCQNARCQEQFDTWSNYPRCPKCKCVRTNWIPGGGHIAGKAAFIDKTLKELTGAYGMTNMHEGRAGERAMPALRQQPPAAPASGQMQFAPGFVAPPYTIGYKGEARAVCLPSSVPVTAKVKARTEQALVPSGKVPGPQANTTYIGRSK